MSIVSKLQPFVDRGELAGAVTLVADRERILDLSAVGFADIASKAPMAADTLFWIASQSKPITATALMMLVDEKLVALDDPAEKYLPGFQDLWVVEERADERQVLVRPRETVTVRHLLAHTSGLAFASALESPKLDQLPLWARVAGYPLSPLLHQPGSKYQYSNEGTNTVGRIVEVVTGTPFEDFLQERLFEPLGMTDTTFWPNAEQISRLAKSYRYVPETGNLEEIQIGQLQYPLGDRRNRYAVPAGGLFSTAADAGRFCRMILCGGELDGTRYVSQDAVARMTRKQTGNLPDNYGLCWAVGDGWFGHGGAYATDMTIDTAVGLVTVYLVQHNGFPGDGAKARGVFMDAAKAECG